MNKKNKFKLGKQILSGFVILGFLILFISEISASVQRKKLLIDKLRKIEFMKAQIQNTSVCMADNLTNQDIDDCLEKLREIKILDTDGNYRNIYSTVRRYVILQKINNKIEYKNDEHRLKLHDFNVQVGREDGDLTSTTEFPTPESLQKYLQQKYEKSLKLL